MLKIVNVFVQIILSIQYRVIKQSADDAFYELQNPAEQIQAYDFYVVLAQVPRMTLDQLFEQKDEVAKTVLEELKKVMGDYGYMIDHILIVDIIHDPSVRIAMNEINAERGVPIAACIGEHKGTNCFDSNRDSLILVFDLLQRDGDGKEG
ncbi:hypersensitive-induced response protein 4-like [Bidens hawaiensis]|uniref:hypersensitive-induced response protein 4-like n=1 Tax=Bidens hawaiensis TaxID=980011 RepID=UPI00404A6CC0